MKPEFLIIAIVFVVVTGIIASGVGVAGDGMGVADVDSEVGFMSYLWLLVTFRAPGVPAWINSIMVAPLMIGVVYGLVRLIRGGG